MRYNSYHDMLKSGVYFAFEDAFGSEDAEEDPFEEGFGNDEDEEEEEDLERDPDEDEDEDEETPHFDRYDDPESI